MRFGCRGTGAVTYARKAYVPFEYPNLPILSITQKSCPPKGTIVEKLQGPVLLTSPSRTLWRQSKYVKIPTVKSRFWPGSEGWGYSPPKSKLEVVPQRDDFWLNGNASSHGSITAAFKLSLAGPLLVTKLTRNRASGVENSPS